MTSDQKPPKAKKEVNLKTWITPVLRRATYRWPPRNECLKNARVARGLYKCKMCEGEFKQQQVCIDHVEPVVPLDNSMMDFNDPIQIGIFVQRMYPKVDGFQILCDTCHTAKTQIEDEMRKQFNQRKKEQEKLDKKKKKE